MRLNNKIIIVTGSTTGIGKAIAKRCVKEGAKVMIHGLELDWAHDVLDEIGKENGAVYVEDLSNEGACERLVDMTIKSFGKINAVVNNAAKVVSSNIATTNIDFLERVFHVNTFSPFMLVKHALPYLTASKGAVLNIGSVNAYSGEPNLLAYSMSKGALMTMTRNLGDTLHRENGVRVNQINPGWVLTETEKKRKNDHGLPEDWYKDLPSVYAPAGRILWPEEIAAAAIYWLSDESGPVSGQVVDIEQHPFIGRNPPKDSSTIPTRK
ncbi:MAG: SDR family NAD(P)-dependent oxidoreductase [Bacteroidota bacterium]|jgi:NAD(P)-dependent dehydrogenase (short-subunit alcohol dehydrogenase family)